MIKDKWLYKNIEGKIVSDSKINTNRLENKKISFIYLNKHGKKDVVHLLLKW